MKRTAGYVNGGPSKELRNVLSEIRVILQKCSLDLMHIGAPKKEADCPVLSVCIVADRMTGRV